MKVHMTDFAEIESLFSNLLIEANEILSTAECAEIQEYIDVGEYGLALRTTIAIYVEERKIATSAIRDLIKKLAKLMDINPEALINRLSHGGE
jgi:hypothetical protein